MDESGRRKGGRQQQQQQQHCGLCSLVARAFRRAVCGAPSRRGSGDSYQELTAPPPIEEEQIVQQQKKEQEVQEEKQQYKQEQEQKVSFLALELLLLYYFSNGMECSNIKTNNSCQQQKKMDKNVKWILI